MLPSPSELQYFIEVSQTLNISRAAERLGISQPSLSLAIRRLEDSFGLPLLIRSKSGVELTRAGHRLVGQARTLLQDWNSIRDTAMKEEQEIRGRFTLGCHASVGLYTLPLLLPELLRKHPQLEFKIVHELSRRITEEVISFRVDFGIVVNPVEHPDLVIKPLFEDEVTLWQSTSKSRNDDVLICDAELAQTQSILKQLSKKGIHFKRVMDCPNLEVITELTRSGAGIGIIPRRVATRGSHPGIKPVEGSPGFFSDRICLVYRADAQKSRASRAISEVVLKLKST